MRILITGGAGFVGCHLASHLLTDGHEVVSFDNYTRPSAAGASCARHGFVALKGDVRDAAALRRAMEGVDTVYHLAAQAQVQAANRDPRYCLETNVVGTYNVLTSAQASGVRRVVFASSREVYGEPVHLPVSETSSLAPINTYGASKVAAEAYCRTAGNQGRLSTVILRFANVYGPGDRDRLVPRWLHLAQANADIEVFGGRQVLDMVWIGIAVRALVIARDEQIGPTVVNIGTGSPSRIDDIASRVLAATGSDSRVVVRPSRKDEVVRYVADVRRMEETLGIAPPSDPLAGIDLMAVSPIRRRALVAAPAF